MTTDEDLCNKIAIGIYGKPGNPEAPENQREDFKAGYAVGLEVDPGGSMDAIHREWARIGEPELLPNSFMEWKRGMWAAVMKVTLSRSSSIHQDK